MSQTKILISTLKAQLKAHGKTYCDVADHLQLSHASVKRMFCDQKISLTRLESICDLVELSFADLVLSMTLEHKKIDSLTLQQEQEIAEDLLLLLTTVNVINGYTFNDLIEQYSLNELQCIQQLAKLDKLNIIELLPGNRFKLKISSNFSWLANGPIQRFFLKHVQEEFFASQFDQPTEKLMVINGLLSLGSNVDIQKKMLKLAADFSECRNEDGALKMEQKHGTTLVVAIRQWNSRLFDPIRKN